MAKFHINGKGVPSVCKAEKGKCPFGGDNSHFKSEVEAQQYADKINEERFGILKNISSDGNKIYDIPENTVAEVTIDKNLFLKDNHSLKKSGDIWVHLDSEDKVIGTMQEPVILMRENGELLEITDGESEGVKESITKLKTLKLMSKFGLVSSAARNSANSINLYTPTSNFDEYKTSKQEQIKEQEKQSLKAFKIRIEQRGGNKTEDLFSDGKSEISKYFKDAKNNVTNPEIIKYNPDVDNWEETVPSADNFAISAYQNKNLDIQKINDKWAVTDNKGEIYGRLDNPAIAVNFDTEKIESIGEVDRIEAKCKMAENDERFTKDGNRMLNRIGMVKLDSKSNDLNKVRNLFEYSWAFKE